MRQSNNFQVTKKMFCYTLNKKWWTFLLLMVHLGSRPVRALALLGTLLLPASLLLPAVLPLNLYSSPTWASQHAYIWSLVPANSCPPQTSWFTWTSPVPKLFGFLTQTIFCKRQYTDIAAEPQQPNDWLPSLDNLSYRIVVRGFLSLRVGHRVLPRH